MKSTKVFQLGQLIGETARSQVYNGTYAGSPAVFKHLRPDLSDTRGSDRFRYEFELTRSVESPYVVRAIANFEHDGRPMIVLEDFSGQSLARYAQARTLSLEETLSIGAQIASGLAAIHDAGIIHKDISLANILISPDKTVKISDFGIAIRTSKDRSYSHGGAMEGTLH